MKVNFLNITERQIDEPIFRIVSIDRLFELFTSKQNVLVKPKLWKDPFEMFLMNSTGELENGKLLPIRFRDHLYGQCWTRTKESNAMWQTYSLNAKGVRITTTPRKLIKAMYDSIGEVKGQNCYIGKVNYYTTLELKILLEDCYSNWKNDFTSADLIQTLLFKIITFKHEDEIRLIYNSQGEEKSDYYRFTIDPCDLIDKILFDSRIEYKEFIKGKKELRKLGFTKRVVKSNFYNSNKSNINV